MQTNDADVANLTSCMLNQSNFPAMSTLLTLSMTSCHDYDVNDDDNDVYVSVMMCEKCASDQTMQIAYGRISIIYIRHAAMKSETSVYGHDKRNRK